MKRAGVFSFVVLSLLISSALPVCAQSTEQSGNTLTVLTTKLENAICPVSIGAEHRPQSSNMMLLSRRQSNHGQPQDVSQQLHLNLTNTKATQVVALQVRVHGTSAKLGTTQTGETTAPETAKNGITMTLNLQLTVNPKAETALDLSLRGFTSVQRVDLDAVTYADGSTWQASGAQSCRFVPDGLMLVSRR